MRVIAITGGIGSGKSTVRRIFEELGAVGIDADDLARQVVAPGTLGQALIRDAFGEEFFDGKGRLDRAKLARKIFSDGPSRRLLESILHPLIKDAEAHLIRQALSENPERPVVVEIPLLVEVDQAGHYDGVILVTASEALRLDRLEKAGTLTRKEARARMRSQAKEEERARVADWTINNDGPLENARKQVEKVLRDLIG